MKINYLLFVFCLCYELNQGFPTKIDDDPLQSDGVSQQSNVANELSYDGDPTELSPSQPDLQLNLTANSSTEEHHGFGKKVVNKVKSGFKNVKDNFKKVVDRVGRDGTKTGGVGGTHWKPRHNHNGGGSAHFDPLIAVYVIAGVVGTTAIIAVAYQLYKHRK